jgi:hypothetical protein
LQFMKQLQASWARCPGGVTHRRQYT